MQKLYTQNDLIRYVYKETDPAEELRIVQQLDQNEQAVEELENLQSIVSQLDEIGLDPDPTSIDLILEYSLKLHEPAH